MDNSKERSKVVTEVIPSPRKKSPANIGFEVKKIKMNKIIKQRTNKKTFNLLLIFMVNADKIKIHLITPIKPL